MTQEEMLQLLEKSGEGDYRPVPLERFKNIMGDSDMEGRAMKNLFFVASEVDPARISASESRVSMIPTELTMMIYLVMDTGLQS